MIDIEDDLATKHEGEIYVAKIIEDFKLARSLFRKNLLQASRAITQTRHNQVTETFFRPKSPPNTQPDRPSSTNSLRNRRPTSQNDNSFVTAASDVTLALKRTHALLEQELEKSNLSLETLEHSSQTLRQLEHRYSAFDVLLNGSKRLIIELERADKWDRWMIYAGLAVFGLVCMWILYKRLLRGPLGLILWGARKIVGSGKAVSPKSAVASSTSVESIGETVLSSTTVKSLGQAMSTSSLVKGALRNQRVEL